MRCRPRQNRSRAKKFPHRLLRSAPRFDFGERPKTAQRRSCSSAITDATEFFAATPGAAVEEKLQYGAYGIDSRKRRQVRHAHPFGTIKSPQTRLQVVAAPRAQKETALFRPRKNGESLLQHRAVLGLRHQPNSICPARATTALQLFVRTIAPDGSVGAPCSTSSTIGQHVTRRRRRRAAAHSRMSGRGLCWSFA